MATKIQIKRTNTGNIPQTVNAGELVYVAHSAGTNANATITISGAVSGSNATNTLTISNACLLYTSPSPRDS